MRFSHLEEEIMVFKDDKVEKVEYTSSYHYRGMFPRYHLSRGKINNWIKSKSLHVVKNKFLIRET